MSPINPSQILQAFNPLLTEKGGIKPADQSQFKKIYKIMKNCSTKLVSKCIYYQILMSTSPDVLEKFLKIGGWDLICLWVKSSRDIGNVTYLIDLLKLLHILPMNIDRLRENECPKIVKKLCKHENQEIALNANLIFKKWKNIIETVSGKNSNGDSNSSNNNSGSGQAIKDKKRKSSTESEYKNDQKKQKLSTITSNTSIESIDGKTSSIIGAESSSALDSNETINSNQEKSATTKRPVTVKVKQGKFRLILSSTSTKTTDNNNRVKKITIKNVDDNKISTLKNDMENNSLKMNTKTSATNGNNKNILKDSMSFMDALSMMPAVGNKKRRKLTMNNHSNTNNNNNNNNNNPNSNNNININNISNDNINNNKDIDSKSGINNETNKKLNKISSSLSSSASSSSSSSSPPPATVTAIVETNNNNDSNLVAKESQMLVKNEINDSNLVLINDNNNNNNNNNSSVEDSRNKKMIQFYTEYTDSLVEENKDCNNENSSCTSSSSSTNVDDDNHCQIADVKLESTTINDLNFENNGSTNCLKNETNGSKLSINTDTQSNNNNNNGGGGCIQPKSILCIIKKNSKKSVRWPDDDKLNQIKYFELDETERINVTRPSDMKRCDMKHEAQMMNESKKGRCLSFGPWKLVPIDPLNSLPSERGRDSKEKLIQAERMQTTLECFYFNDQIPDNPEEPDNCFEFINEEKIVIIPLEDENTIDRFASMNTNPIESNNYIQNMPFDAVNYNNNRDNFFPFNSAPTNNNLNPYAPPPPPQSVPPLPPNVAGPLPFVPPVTVPNNNVNYLSQTAPPSVPNNFDGCNTANYPMYNNYQNSAVTNQPQQVGPMPPPPSGPFPNPNPGDMSNVPYQDYNSNPNNYGPPFSGADNGINQNPPIQSSNMYPMPNQTNFYNGNNLPPVNQPATNENFTNYWPENNSNNNNTNNNGNNYPPAQSFPSQPPGGSGQKFRGRGNNSRGRGPFKNNNNNNNNEVCRFFFKHGKCKFDTRCNYAHVLDNQKSTVRF